MVVLYRNKVDPDDMHKEDVYMAAEESEAGRADMKVSLKFCDPFCEYGPCQQGQAGVRCLLRKMCGRRGAVEAREKTEGNG